MNIEKLKKVRDYVCKGCGSYINKEYRSSKKLAPCRVVHKKNGQICPCSQCLVKSMCETQCDEFRDYSNMEVDPKTNLSRFELNPPEYTYTYRKGGRFGASSSL